MQYFLKTLIAAALIVVISEVSRRSNLLAAIFASIPIISVMAIIFLYYDTGSVAAVSALSWGVFWLVLPSLVFFISLPLMLKKYNFPISLFSSLIIMIVAYFILISLLKILGVRV